MIPTRPPRRDPVLLYRIQSDFAAGLAPAQIAEKHALPVYTVTQALRRDRSPHALPDPYALLGRARGSREAALVYWVGYAAACGALYDGPVPTLVLDVDPRDRAHVDTLLDDLCDGRPACEYCSSSTRGLQAYIRDRDLGRLLVRWGIPGVDRSAGSVPVALIPAPLLSHFVRGYLEGGRRRPPFGLQVTPRSLVEVRKIVLAGPPAFLEALRKALRGHVQSAGTLQAGRRGAASLTYRGAAARRLLRFAYRGAARSLPRAERLRRSLRLPVHPNGAGSPNGTG